MTVPLAKKKALPPHCHVPNGVKNPSHAFAFNSQQPGFRGFALCYTPLNLKQKQGGI
jgi:hypothetical protein